MKKTRFAAAAAAAVLLLCALAFADPALPSFDRYDPDVVKSLTWTEGTPFYDYVCYIYDYDERPEYSFRVFACGLDMESALLTKEGNMLFLVDPLFMGSYDTLLPYLDIQCQGCSSTIARAELTVGDLSLTAEAPKGSELSAFEDGTAELLITAIGSNQITLISALEAPGVRPRLTLTFADGTEAACTFSLPADPEENPFYWLHRLLTESRYLDESGCLNESARLLCAHTALDSGKEVLLSLSGAAWIDDLADSVRAYPLKLEYAPDSTAGLASFCFDVLNYAGTFVDTDVTVSSFDLLWYPLDENGDPLPFADGSMTAAASFKGPVAPGEEKTFSVTAGLPEAARYVAAAISSFTASDGQKMTVPDRDLVFVYYEAAFPDTSDL